MRRQRSARLVKLAAGCLIIIIAAALVSVYVYRVLRSSEYFKIKDIVSSQDAGDFSYLKGKNIFSTDLKRESARILGYYPDSSKIRIARLLPDRLIIYSLKRTPFALLKLYRYFAVDKDGVLFSPSDSSELDLPVILGLETKIFGPKPGQQCNIRELRAALSIIKEINANDVLNKYKIKRINMVNFANATLFMMPLGQELEVRLSTDNIKNRIKILTGLLMQERNDLGKIKYIDLRFSEPVIKFNDK